MGKTYRVIGPQLQRFSCGRIVLLALLVAVFSSLMSAQTTGTVSGTVLDQAGAAVPKANVALVNQASNDTRRSVSNDVGYFSFVGVVPGVYTVTVEAQGFKSWKRAEITVDPGDVRAVPGIKLEVGQSTETITVEATPDEVAPVDSGERSAVLTTKEIDKLTLASRNVTTLMKILPGVTTQPGLGAGSGIDWINTIGSQGSLVGNGLDANGAPNRGGTSITNDGVNIIDPGCNCWGIQTVLGDMTQEVKVQTSNFGADSNKGPVVVNSIGKSGGSSYHGEGYLHVRNDALNANTWQNNHNNTPNGTGHYYYPGGSFGGPVPGTHKKLIFWFGYMHFYQNTGATNSLESYVPSDGMRAGDFTATGTGNSVLCPNGFQNGTSDYCQTVSGNSFAPNGTAIATDNISAFIDPGAVSMMNAVFPAANRTPDATDPHNYRVITPSLHNGYIWRTRVDYSFNDNTKIYVSYQYGGDNQLSQGNGAHMWWTPGNAIPFPGGGMHSPSISKAATAHFLHVFSPTLTNEVVAAWGWGSAPNIANVEAVSRDKNNYPTNYGTVYKLGAAMIPGFYSPSDRTFPDFSQADVFENPTHSFPTKKEMPSFADDITKVWRSHTIKMGGFYESTSNYQGEWLYPNGIFSYGTGINPDQANPLNQIGSKNPFAAFLMGEATGYNEDSTKGVTDMAYHTVSGYIQDNWKLNRRLTLNLGFRVDHIGRWYDRQGNGMAVFLPGRIESDMRSGKLFPGIYWHGIDPGIPNSGSPSKGAYMSPRFGLAYDVFGTGKTVIRGGWGAYRWNDQYNDYSNPLTIAQQDRTFALNNSRNILLSEVGQLTPPAAVWSPSDIGGVADPLDYQSPVTYSYNFTVSQALPGKSLLEVAYVGSNSEHLLIGGGSGASDCGTGCNFINQNKVPLGGLFGPDRICGSAVNDPTQTNCFNANASFGAEAASTQDYTPYGWVQEASAGQIPGIEQCNPDTGSCFVQAYGSHPIKMSTHSGYSNYNALQLTWLKQTGRLNFNLNYTYSKTLGTSAGIDAFTVHGNYGVVGVDRPHVFNASYAYSVPTLTHGSKILGGVTNGWTVSGLFTWQAGGDLQALYSRNYNLAIGGLAGQPLGFSSKSFFGTDAQQVMPVLTCNPGSGLSANQRAKLSCFGVPSLTPGVVNANGPGQEPYLHGPIYWNSDLGIYKTFHITERQNVELRLSAFNFLNHPLREFISNDDQLKLTFQGDITNPGAGFTSTVTNPKWGYLNSKDGQRVVELELKYSF